MKLGSLFSGSGGFELAGAINGIEPVWASEIEPYPIRVTKARFPQMKHLGSVLDVNGAEIEPVDIITFGSPCQDLSVAGKQAGLHKGERSNLFFEAIRIIKEMREATDGKYPRIAVWENVPGAYSSNKGEDFRAVLKAFVRLREQAADVPMPKGNKWATAGCIVGNGYSVAWRTLDAQYNGVPQRRRRIYLIADFGSERAGEILFEQEGSYRDTTQGGTAREGAADNVEGSAGGSGVRCLNSDHPQSSRIYDADGIYPCLSSNASGGLNRQAVAYSVDCRNMNLTKEHGTLQAKENGGQSLNYMGAVCYPINTMVATRWNKDDNRTTFGIGEPGDPQFTLGAAHEHAVCYPIDSHQQDSRFKVCADGISPTLPGQMGTGGNNGPMALESYQKVTGPLMANSHPGSYSGQDAYSDMLVTQPAKPPRKYIIRRLTPLECVRLQGLPDGWLDGVDGSDSAKYKMLGNGIAMPNAIYVVGCAVQLLQEGKHENEG